MDKNYVYTVKTQTVNSGGWMSEYTRLYGDLKKVLDHMEWNDLVFLDEEQVERLRHGDTAVFTSKSKRRKEGSFTIGIIESMRIN